MSASFMDQVLPGPLYVGLAGLPVVASDWEGGRWRCQVTLRILFLSFSVPLAEASPASWWNPTGRSRRQARNSRSSLLVQTGNVRWEGAVQLPMSAAAAVNVPLSRLLTPHFCRVELEIGIG